MILNKGNYYIGDPCYFIKDEDWMDFLDQLTGQEYEGGTGEVNFKGKTLFTSSTKYGDGTYLDNGDNRYPVDTGLISVIPTNIYQENPQIKGYYIDTTFVCETVDDEGVIRIGDIEIYT